MLLKTHSNVGKEIALLWDTLSANSIWVTGNGREIKVFEDPWLGDLGLIDPVCTGSKRDELKQLELCHLLLSLVIGIMN